MREQKLSWLGKLGDPHCIGQFEMRLYRFITIERAFENQKIGITRELRETFGETGVGSVNQRRAIRVSYANCQTFAPMRSRNAFGMDAGKDLEAFRYFRRRDLVEFYCE